MTTPEKINKVIAENGGNVRDALNVTLAKLELAETKLKEIEDSVNDPYWFWPQCDVDGCTGVSSNGGGCWRETGYWSVCFKHSQGFRNGIPQPKMKQTAILRERSRGKDGILVIDEIE